MWMPAQTTVPPGATARSAAGTSRADRREDDRRVERFRRRIERAAAPGRPELEREALGRGIAGPREREHAPALTDRDLGDDVGGGAEAVEADPAALARHPQRPVADQPGAEQWCSLLRPQAVRDRQAVALVRGGQLGIAAVPSLPGEHRSRAEVLAAGEALLALPAGPGEPRHPDPVADLESGGIDTAFDDPADDLVTGDDGELRGRDLAVGEMQIRPAHPAGLDLDQDLPGPRLRAGRSRRPPAAHRAALSRPPSCRAA